MLARFTNGRLHLLDGVVSDNSNFFLIEAFDGMKDEDFAVGAPKASQRSTGNGTGASPTSWPSPARASAVARTASRQAGCTSASAMTGVVSTPIRR